MIRHHLNYNRLYQHFNFLLLLSIIIVMRIALSSAIQHSLAYIQPKGSSNISKPLRAWMCSGKSNKQLVDNLAAVSYTIYNVHMICAQDMFSFFICHIS